jgi:hypothetical protein
MLLVSYLDAIAFYAIIFCEDHPDLLSGVDQAIRGCVRGRESHRRSNRLEQKPMSSKTTLTSCQE